MKRSIAFVAGVAVALCIGTAGAYFTGEAQVAENVIRAGNVSVSCEPTQSALSIDPLAPGVASARVMTVRNDGTLPQTVVVTGAKKLGITAFYEALQVTVTHEGVVVYRGALSAMRTLPVDVGVGKSEVFTFTVELPPDCDPDLAGDYVKLTLYVDAEQSHS